MNIALIGGGAWGTALGIAFAPHHRVTLWCREDDVLADIAQHRENSRFLPHCPIPESLHLADTMASAAQSADLILIATPTAGLRSTLSDLAALQNQAPVLWVCKGFEAQTGLLPHQVLAQVRGDFPGAVLSGPSFAEEVAHGAPTAVSLAANRWPLAQDLARALHLPHLRIYANDDLVGVEVGGAAKNVLAIATGICDGLQMSHNSRAALITRGLAEIARLGVALGAKRETFMGLSGIGDMLLTCVGGLSRNRRVGLALAEGRLLDDILADLGHVAEGVYTAREVVRLADKHQVDMPISRAVLQVLNHEGDIATFVEELLSRDNRAEGF